MAEKPQPPQKPAAPPLPQPKVSLRQLDDDFIRDIDDEGLDPLVRLWAGRIHQVLVHLRLLRLAVRDLTLTQQKNMQEAAAHFLAAGPAAAPGSEAAAPEEAEGPPDEGAAPPDEAAAEAAAPPPPPVVPLRSAQARRPRPGAQGGSS